MEEKGTEGERERGNGNRGVATLVLGGIDAPGKTVHSKAVTVDDASGY